MYIFDNTVNPDFGLLDLDGDPDRHQNLITWSMGMLYPSKKFCQNPFQLSDRQTNRQTKQTKVKT